MTVAVLTIANKSDNLNPNRLTDTHFVEIAPVICLIFLAAVHLPGDPKEAYILRRITIDQNLTVYLGGGGNSVVLVSDDRRKAIIVDTKYLGAAKKLRREVASPEVTIINTHFHLDHARGNRLYAGAFVVSGQTNWKQWDFDTVHSARPDIALKPGEEMSFAIDDEVVHAVDMGSAHSPNDLVVYFEKRKLLVGGDLVWVDMHPVLLDKNTNLRMWIDYLSILERDYDIETVVPGHGIVCGKEAISDMKRYFQSVAGAIGNRRKFRELRAIYSGYKTFPIFGNLNRTRWFLAKEAR